MVTSTPMLGRENEIDSYRTDPVKYDLEAERSLREAIPAFFMGPSKSPDNIVFWSEKLLKIIYNSFLYREFVDVVRTQTKYNFIGSVGNGRSGHVVPISKMDVVHFLAVVSEGFESDPTKNEGAGMASLRLLSGIGLFKMILNR
ncbi:hypothetical protein P5V15_014335 [Pogonomyrmex californicus]